MSTNVFSLLNIVITLALIVGGVFAYRHGFARTAEEVQERVINALQSELETLRERLGALEKENHRLNQLLLTIRSALKLHGLRITIDGGVVSIHDVTGATTHTVRIIGSGTEADDKEEIEI